MPRVFSASFVTPCERSNLSEGLRSLIEYDKIQRSRAAKALKSMRRRLRSQNSKMAQAAQTRGYSVGFDLASQALVIKAQEVAMRERQCIESANRSCLDLALRVAKQFVTSLLETESAHLSALVEGEIARLTTTKILRIVVHPSQLLPIQQRVGKIHSIEIGSSEELGLTDVRIESINGIVLLRWQERFDLLARTLSRQLGDKLETSNVSAA